MGGGLVLLVNGSGSASASGTDVQVQVPHTDTNVEGLVYYVAAATAAVPATATAGDPAGETQHNHEVKDIHPL